jgi:tellurium resistance protein TerD
MALINCPECSREISDKAEACPQCGCPIAKRQSSIKPVLPPMIWEYEEPGYISVKCPSCGKSSNVKETSALKTTTGYKLNGEGQCACGLVFKEIYRDERIKCPKCGSTEIVVQKEGFDAGSACCGAFLVGPLGLLCGSKEANKLNRHCLNCAHKWRVGK